MPLLQIPVYPYDLYKDQDHWYIFDIIRKKYIQLTPEEWVRQRFLHWLIREHQYPKSLIRIESGFEYNNRRKRSDIVVYDRQAQPFMVIECKSEQIALSEESTFQASVYNAVLKAKYLVITNGIYYFPFEIDFEKESFTALTKIPTFDSN